MNNLKVLALVGLSFAPIGILVSALVSVSNPIAAGTPQINSADIALARASTPCRTNRGGSRRNGCGK